MRKTTFFLLAGYLCFTACSSDNIKTLHPESEPTDSISQPALEGYASPNGILILNGGARMLENGSLSYIAPDGTVETNVYKKVNGTELGNQADALYRHGNKLYILCDNYLDLDDIPQGDGLLIIADAETMRKEKAYLRETMTFARPEGCLQENERLEVEANLSNIIVLDEHNVFITDAQAAYRFDSTTDELHLIEGSYALGNQGVTIESIISPNGMMAIDGHIYAGAGGFWSETKLVEFSKDSNQINRTLALGKGNLISGLCLLDDGTLVAATYTRGNNVTYLYYIDLESWNIAKETEIRTSISPDYFNTASSSIFSYKNNIYFPESETRISRLSADNGKIEPYLDVRKDAPNANGFDCMTIDAQNGKLYISTHSECFENVIPQSNVLIYDLNSDSPQATRCISDITHYATGIYPM